MSSRISQNKKKWIKGVINNVLYPVLAMAIVIAVWAIVAKVKDKPLLLPMPSVVFRRFILLFSEEKFWKSISSTLLRTFLSFGISFVAGYAVAFLASKYRPFAAVFDTIVAVLRAAPTVAVILITYAFFHTKSMTVIVGFLIAFPILYSAFLGALRGVDERLVAMTIVYRLNPLERFLHAYFLRILPFVFDISKSTLSLTLKVVISAEILTLVSNSVGGAIYNANATFESAYLFSWTTMAIFLSFLLEIIVESLKRVCVRWGK